MISLRHVKSTNPEVNLGFLTFLPLSWVNTGLKLFITEPVNLGQ